MMNTIMMMVTRHGGIGDAAGGAGHGDDYYN